MAPHVFATLISVAVLALVNSCTNGKLITSNLDQVDNTINNAPPARISGFRTKDWIKISEAPPEVINTRLGERVEIECEVLGSPTPEIQWRRGNQIVQQEGKRPSKWRTFPEGGQLYQCHTERVNTNIHSSLPSAYHDKAGLAKIKSRLVIDCVTSAHEGFYTCVAKAGSQKVNSQPSLILAQGGNGESCNVPEEKKFQPPRIITWNPTAMENMGVDVLLPCQAQGNPPPKMYWLDQDGEIVNNARFQTLSNGDLAIYRLAWSDMGQYTCVADNDHGRDAVTTFIYPVLNEK